MFAPVIAGFWTHRDIVDGVFDLDDLADIHEVMAVKAENEARALEAEKLKGDV